MRRLEDEHLLGKQVVTAVEHLAGQTMAPVPRTHMMAVEPPMAETEPQLGPPEPRLPLTVRQMPSTQAQKPPVMVVMHLMQVPKLLDMVDQQEMIPGQVKRHQHTNHPLRHNPINKTAGVTKHLKMDGKEIPTMLPRQLPTTLLLLVLL